MLKKKIIQIFTVLLVSLILTITIVGNLKVKAASANIRYLTACVGELPTSININYNIDVTGSRVELSKTQDFAQSKFYDPTESEFEYICSDPGYGWEKRIVCKLSITDLDESTKYYYRVQAGTEYSDVLNFTTGTLKSVKQSILWVTDIHAAPGTWSNTTGVNQELKNIIEKNNYDVRLMVSTGDQIDRSGMETHEQTFYNDLPYIRQFVQAVIPGNHEFYTTSGGDYKNPNVFNAIWNNPQNGPSTNLNTSYWFKTGDILFLMIDCVKQDNYKVQSDWAKKVVEENPSKWIIMGSHAGFVTAGSYVSDSTYMNNYWRRVMEECQVDLCIAGHEHVYMRKVGYYQKKQNSTLGVTYITSLSSGPKQYGLSANYKDYDFAIGNKTFTSNIITVDGDTMTIKLYDQNGDLYENGTVTLQAKRDLSKSITDEEILNSVSYEYNDGLATVKFDGNAYATCSKVNFINTIDGEEAANIDLKIASVYTNEKAFGVNSSKNNHVKVVFTKRDGTTIETSFDINNYKEKIFNITYELDGGTFGEQQVVETYKPGETPTFTIPTKEGYEFDGWYTSNTFVEGSKKEAVAETDSYNLKLYAKWNELIVPVEPEPQPKSGCNSSAVLVMISLFTSVSVIYILVRKH